MTETVQTFGHYDLLEELGRGATGTVWRARHRVLEREVALKIYKPKGATEGWQLRLMREARAAAKLEHPNIARVYEATEIDGTPCLAFELIRGQTLKDRLDRDGTFEPLAALALIEKVARAVHHAHELGIVHRDLKPANILIDSSGEPRIVDFGVAKDLTDPRSQLSESGTLVGTPAYLAPEQAEGRVHDIDRRADIWALGLVLYEMLSGKNPFRNDNVFKLLETIRFTELPPPLTPAGVSTRHAGEIALWALRKKREERPPTALALAEACRVALEGAREPAPTVSEASASGLPARAPSALKPAAILVANLIAIGLLAAGITVQLRKHDTQPVLDPSPVPSASVSSAPVRPSRPVELDPGAITTSVHAFLAAYPPTLGTRPIAGTGDIRGRLAHPVTALAASPDGQHLVAGSAQGEVCLFDAVSGKLVEMHARVGRIATLSFSDDGSFIAVGRDDGSVELADAISLAALVPTVERADRSPSPSPKPGLEAFPKRVLVPDDATGKTTLRWLSSSGKSATVHVTAPGGTESDLAQGPSGTRDLNVNLGLYRVKLIEPGRPDVEIEVRGLPQHALPGDPPGKVLSVAFSPDSRLVAAAFDGAAPALWDRTDSKRVDLQGAKIRTVAFSEDGKLLAGGSEDGTISLWNTTSGMMIGRTATLPVGSIHQLVRTARGIVIGGSQAVALFDLADRKTRWVHPAGGPGVDVAIAALERGPILVAHLGGAVQLLEGDTGKKRREWKLPGRPLGLAISADGKRAWSTFQSSVSLWETDTAQRAWPTGGDDALVTGLGETPEGGLFVSRHDGSLEVVDEATGQRSGGTTLRTTHAACLSRNGGAALVSLAGPRPSLVAVDLGTWTESARSEAPNEVTLLVPSSQGPCYFSDNRGSLGVWPVTSGATVLPVETSEAAQKGGAIFGVACAHEKKVLAWCTHDAIFLRDGNARAEVLPDLPTRPPLHALALSDSGNLVLVGRNQGQLELFDRRLRSWKKLEGSAGRQGAPVIAFTRDERLIVSGTLPDHALRVWSVATGKEVDRFALPFDAVSSLLPSGSADMIVGTRRGLVLKLRLEPR